MKSTPNLVRLLLIFLLLADPSNIIALSESQNSNSASARTRALLQRLNKPYLKSIQSPDGDVIDCVPSHLQPAFDHPMLRGQTPSDPPERPRRSAAGAVAGDVIQLWRAGGDACPEGTVAIRRTKEEDLRRVAEMGRKPVASAPPSYNFSSHESGTYAAISTLVRTATQMGSGHYAAEGYGKAAYIRNIGVINETLDVNSTVPNLTFITEALACYDVQGGANETWGAYFFFGGPGRSNTCP